jgi:hypothetical protein
MEIHTISRKTVTKMSSETPPTPLTPPVEKLNDLSALETKKVLTPAAKRALAEAAERRAKEEAEIAKAIEEGGPNGPEPTRYGDWERKGIVSDF